MSNNTTITAGVASGVVIRTTIDGLDPDFANVTGLLPDCQYLRLKNTDGSYAYVALSELDTLRVELTNKASAVDLELLQSDIDDKATKSQIEDVINLIEENKVDEGVIEAMLTAIDNKAEKTVVDGVAAELLTKADVTDMDTLADIVDGKASQTSVNDLIADVNALKTTLGVLTDDGAIEAIQTQINYLNDEINRRLTIDDIRSINTSVTQMTSTVAELEELVNGFDSRLSDTASAEGVTQLRNNVADLVETVNRLESRLSSKADAASLASKASHEELLRVAERLTRLSTTVNDHTTASDDAIKDINAALRNKIGTAEHTVSVNNLTSQIDLKADKSVIGPQLQTLEREYNRLRNQVTELENSVEGGNYDTEINSLTKSVQTLNTKISEANTSNKALVKDVEKLNTWKSETSKNLKSQWVRVLSSKEYKNLRPAGENTLQDYNPRYRYPNTVYLVVDFNKPKAIYIGDILVAQAESKGSIGFAYTFPISF